jgi:hypothetical protein
VTGPRLALGNWLALGWSMVLPPAGGGAGCWSLVAGRQGGVLWCAAVCACTRGVRGACGACGALGSVEWWRGGGEGGG